ncbi:DUF3658 domain-containing protein [Bradyrhizobium canariense]|uniref:DUF3658 domain-containing protein n=1 Tax=Bradyrhizobium canariense TaxID=255045 RepID=A0A1H1YX43_9BRAD|nr:DUF3658 domain-containing protein [Bradyrhizobium canariense]SDT25899.1 Protein of unknown function [Bradyrhizobium canariense]
MDKEQAAEIQRHLLDAADAIDRASVVLVGLSKEDRAALAVPLGDILTTLHFELLQAVYDRHPALKPPQEPAVVSSFLRWDDVSLPDSVSEADIDSIIFSLLTSRWQKMAMVVGKAVGRCKERALPIGDEVLGARIQALAESDRLDSQGDLRKWRHSEVRLKH